MVCLTTVACTGVKNSPASDNVPHSGPVSVTSSPVPTATSSPVPTATPNITATMIARNAQINQFIEKIPGFSITKPEDREKEVGQPELKDDFSKWQIIQCTQKEFFFAKYLDKFVAFELWGEKIWPGVIFEGQTISGIDPSIIPLSRAPGKIEIEGLPFPPGSTLQTTLGAPGNKAQTLQTINSLLQQLPDTPISPMVEMYYSMAEIRSFEQAYLEIGVPSSMLKELSGSIQLDKSKENHSVLIKFIQPYYRVRFQYPASAAGFFEGVYPNELDNYMGQGNPPVYISSVTYGRMLLFMASSTYTSDEIKAALNFSFFNKNFDASSYNEATLRKIFNTIEIDIITRGGPAIPAAKLISARNFGEFIEKGAFFSKNEPAAPLLYELRYLSNDKLVQISSSANYYRTICEPLPIPEPAVIDMLITNKERGSKVIEFTNRDDIYIYSMFISTRKGMIVRYEIKRVAGGVFAPLCELVLLDYSREREVSENSSKPVVLSWIFKEDGGIFGWCPGTYRATTYINGKSEYNREFVIK